ncbi:PDGLE domain-containing protein [Nakamurella multipartita]|uniref:PDGLE domain-containing protein n=1 Tax=Nakamurella multipartita TaxID=53461 RepID=UPI00019E95EE|nr:PDGLE domain-containing protein [Nakamurella multipartita]
MSRRSIGLFIAGGLALALLLAFAVSPWASSEPDGLERVALDQGFAENATEHATGGSPLADYSVSGVDHGALSTGLSGVIGVLLCFALGAGLLVAIRWSRRRSVARTSAARD